MTAQLETPVADDQAAQLRALVAEAERRAPRAYTPRPEAHLEQRIEQRPRVAPPIAATAPRPALQRPRIVAIASGKGGVGKTSLCVNLSVALARAGRRVALLDGDMGLANADVLSGVRVSGHIGHVLTGARTIEDICVDAPGGFRLIPGASGVAAIIQMAEHKPAALLERLALIERATDVLIIDCGAGISRCVRSFLLAADAPVVVTTPEPTSITDAYAMLKVAIADRRARGRTCVAPALIVNAASSDRQAYAAHMRIAGVCERFLNARPALLGWTPEDQAVRDAVYARTPFTVRSPRSPASRSVRALAERIAQDLRLADPEQGGGAGLVARLVDALRRL